MIRTPIAVALAACTVTAALAQDISLKTSKEKLSYSIGANIGANLKSEGLEISPEQLAAGIKDALSGAKLKMTQEEMKAAIVAYQQELRTQQAQAADKNKKAGETFLAQNKKKPGVQTLPSGLQYKIIKQGAGKKPSATDTVKTHYRGTLLDGTEFDSSYKAGEPVTFPVNGVIKGWTEALQLMPAGSKWQLFIPSDLGYGEEGHGPIAPNSTLIFEVELLSIETAQK